MAIPGVFPFLKLYEEVLNYIEDNETHFGDSRINFEFFSPYEGSVSDTMPVLRDYTTWPGLRYLKMAIFETIINYPTAWYYILSKYNKGFLKIRIKADTFLYSPNVRKNCEYLQDCLGYVCLGVKRKFTDEVLSNIWDIIDDFEKSYDFTQPKKDNEKG